MERYVEKTQPSKEVVGTVGTVGTMLISLDVVVGTFSADVPTWVGTCYPLSAPLAF
jgi:hypothetical protein